MIVYNITITVHYDEATLGDDEEFFYALEKNIDRAIGDGMLSPDGAEIVDELDIYIERIE